MRGKVSVVQEFSLLILLARNIFHLIYIYIINRCGPTLSFSAKVKNQFSYHHIFSCFYMAAPPPESSIKIIWIQGLLGYSGSLNWMLLGSAWLKKKKQIYCAFIKYVQSKLNICESCAHRHQWLITVSVIWYDIILFLLPEGEDNKAGDDENCSKHGEHAVAGFPPACVVEHFGWLEQKERDIFRVWHFHLFSSRGQTGDYMRYTVLWPEHHKDISFCVQLTILLSL